VIKQRRGEYEEGKMKFT